MKQIVLFGAHLSPYVRKTRLVLALKGLDYTLIPVIPFMPNQPEEFTLNSPLGKIPLLKIDEQYIPDSSVICAFLDKETPRPALLPENNLECARAQWFEEYSDSKMTSVIGGHLFAEKVLAPALFKRASNQKEIDLAINIELPEIFDYLSSQLTGDYLVGDSLTLADISVCSQFVSMAHCQVECDASKWPKLSAYIKRMHSLPVFSHIIKEEQQVLQSFMP